MENEIWTTKDGRVIKITDMEDDHLINTIRLLKRRVKHMRLGHELHGLSVLNFVQGEMATFAIEQSLEQEAAMSDDIWLDHYTPYDELLEEAKRRDIVMFIGAEFFKRMKEIRLNI